MKKLNFFTLFYSLLGTFVVLTQEDRWKVFPNKMKIKCTIKKKTSYIGICESLSLSIKFIWS